MTIPPPTPLRSCSPRRYVVDRIEPIDPEPLGSPGGGWESLRQVGFGAVDLLMLFSAPGDDVGAALSDPRERARGWGGGRVEVWSRGRRHRGRHQPGRHRGGFLRPLQSMVTWELAAFPDHEEVEPERRGATRALR